MGRRIFVSYASADAQVVNAMVTDLKSAGHDVWVDRRLQGGQDWWAEILTAVRRSDVFLQAVSPAAIRSIACDLERRWASDLRRPILPVVLDVGLKAQHQEPALAQLQWLPYQAGDHASTALLLSTVAAMSTAPGLPSPLPQAPAAPESSTSRELPIGRDGLPLSVTVRELVRTNRSIRLRVEWEIDWGVLEARGKGFSWRDQVLWHGDQLELTPVLVPGDDRYIFSVPLAPHYELEGNLRCRLWRILSLYLTKGERSFYEFDPGPEGKWG